MRKISDEKIRHIHRLLGKGLPQKEVASIVGVSVATVNKHVGSQPPLEMPAPSAESLDDIPEAIPEGLDLAVIARWIPKVERAAEAAEAAKDHGAMASLVARLHALVDLQRKASPAPKEDPNENPDMIAAAKRAREMLHKLIESA